MEASFQKSPAFSTLSNHCPHCGRELPVAVVQQGGRCEHCGTQIGPSFEWLADELPFIDRAATIVDLHASDKRDAIGQMVRRLVESGAIDPAIEASVVDTILRREQLGSTGIGHGVAIPHAKHPGIDHLVGSVAWSEQGIPFDSIDSELVNLLVLLVTPPDRPAEHLRMLEKIARVLPRQ